MDYLNASGDGGSGVVGSLDLLQRKVADQGTEIQALRAEVNDAHRRIFYLCGALVAVLFALIILGHTVGWF